MILRNRNVLITGGTGALGQVVANLFIREGARVASSFLFEDELKRLMPDFKESVFVVRADVSEDEDVAALFKQVMAKLGTIHVLINIAGGYLPKANISSVSTMDWDHMMSMNLKSVFICSREYLNCLSDRSYGRIISMAAMPALRPSAGHAPYSISKAGVVMLTYIMGEEMKGSGVTANCIAPSIIKTKANIESMPGEDASKWVSPDEIAATMLYLCSEQAKSINGVCIPMFGGIS